LERFTRFLKLPNVVAERDPLIQPVYQSSIFRMPNYQAAVETEHTVHPNSYYGRWGNPTVSYLENQLSTLCGCEASLVFPTGMSAITTTVFALVSPGDLIAVSTALYGDTIRFFVEELKRFGIKTAWFDPSAPAELPRMVSAGAKLVYFESISNPELRLANFDAIRAACENRDVVTVCDCTFSPPGVLDAAAAPATLIIHSLTKYMGGHYAAFGGSVSGPQHLIDKIWHTQSLYGGAMDPQAAWQISQGLKTLELRIARQNATAHFLAQNLARHPKIEQVFYPLLDARPNAAQARRWLAGGGGVISFFVKGGESAAVRLIEKTRIIGLSVSLGGIHSCIEHSQSMSRSMLTDIDGLLPADLASPAKNLVRLSVGIEDANDLWRDLTEALASA
jgi:cystathionine beta-lyase/cystathionine gamma-synthase